MYVPPFQLKEKHMYLGGGPLQETDGGWFHSNLHPVKPQLKTVSLTTAPRSIWPQNFLHSKTKTRPRHEWLSLQISVSIVYSFSACKESHCPARRYLCSQLMDVQPMSPWIKLLVKDAGLKQTKPTHDWVSERTGWKLYSPWKAPAILLVSHLAPSP